MTIRTDIELAWHRSPRTARVFAPSTELFVQDAHDSLGNLEDSEVGKLHPDLITSAGKENLGGGVSVGITSTLQNTQIMFDARTGPASAATVTTGDATGQTLIDASGTFQADGVDRGYLVINFTDQSMATVLEVDTEGQLQSTQLEGGVDNQYDVADDVKIYQIFEVDLSGGNIVAVDDVGADLPALLPTFGVMVVRTSASSATTQQQEDIEFASFNGGVTIDVINGAAGTTGDIGKPRSPVNNVPDALIIGSTRGLPKQLFIIGNITFTTGQDLTDYKIEGQSALKSIITVDAGALVVDVEFRACTIQGSLDTESSLRDCIVKNITSFEGFITDCSLDGTIVLAGSAETFIINCVDATAGGGAAIATIDMGGSGRGLVVRNFEGGLELINKTGVEEVSIGVSNGRVVLDPTVTNGEILIRVSAGEVVDNSVGATVTANSVLNPTTIAEGVWDEPLTGTTHNLETSAGRRLRQLEEAFVHASGTIVGVTDGHTFTLDSGAVAVDDYYVGDRLQISEGAGAGQSRIVIAYSSSRVIVLDSDFVVNPDTDSLWELASADVHVSVGDADLAEGFVAVANSLTQVTLDAITAVAIDDYYNGNLIIFTHGPGAGQSREIIDYTSGRLVTFSPALEVAVSINTTWHIQAAVSAAEIATEVWTRVLEGSLTNEEALRIVLSVLAGAAISTQAPDTMEFRDVADAKARVIIPIGTDGDRTKPTTLDGT